MQMSVYRYLSVVQTTRYLVEVAQVCSAYAEGHTRSCVCLDLRDIGKPGQAWLTLRRRSTKLDGFVSFGSTERNIAPHCWYGGLSAQLVSSYSGGLQGVSQTVSIKRAQLGYISRSCLL